VRYRFRKEDGWDGYKDIRESSGIIGYKMSLGPGQDVEVSGAHIRYTDTDRDDSIMSNRLFASYNGNLFDKIDVQVGAGVESLENNDGNTGLLAIDLDSQVTDKVQGQLSYIRDIVTDTIASIGRNIVLENINGALSLDLSPYFNSGGSYGITTYSDGNELYDYSLWASLIFITDPALLKFSYQYAYQDAREGNQEGVPVLEDGFSRDDHPYWSPKNYWENSFHIYWKQHLLSDMLEREAPSYYTVEYILGYDSTGRERQSVRGEFSMELTSHVILESAVEFISSDNYRASDLSFTAVYRW
jgi:hypothetical protein